MRLADIRAHPRFEGWPAAHPEMTAFLGMPIVDGDEILGEVFLANKRTPGGFTAADEELLQLLAAHAAIAIVNARLYEQSRELSIVAERQRIAHDLHDAVAQKLFSLRLTAQAAATLLAGADPAGAATQLDTVTGWPARPPTNCAPSWSGCARSTWPATGWNPLCASRSTCWTGYTRRPSRSSGDPLPRLPPPVESAIFRVVQEALHNALRHAAPGTVAVRPG